jgi:hypothetical protein
MDVPGYGRFSNLDGFKGIREELRAKHDAARVAISVIVLTQDRRYQQMKSQFATLDFNNEIKASGKLKPFLADMAYTAAVNNIQDFLAAVEACHVDAETHLRPYAATLTELNDDMPVFMWIADDREAVFSIASFDPGQVHENSFYTRDQKVVEGLVSIFNSYQRTAKPVSPPLVRAPAHTNSPRRLRPLLVTALSTPAAGRR